MAELRGSEVEEELSVTYKLVPWFSWAEWNFVRESLFSSSPDSIAFALRRISTWRCRGCLPVAVDVTAAIIEIQQKDPVFGHGPESGSLDSEEILAMAYCMVIMRLVNGFAEKSREKTGLSISQSAEAIGIPRMLVDIRHECSHRELPSLPLVRQASMKALDWLQSVYWEPQQNSITNIEKEVKSRMHELALYLRARQSQQAGSPQTKAKGIKHSDLVYGRKRLFSQMVQRPCSSKSGSLRAKNLGYKKQITKTARSLIRLYSSFPSETVALLLDEFLRKTSDPSDGVDMVEGSDSSQLDASPVNSELLVGSVDDWKAIITRLSRKEPALLLTLIEAVLKMIGNQEAMKLDIGKSFLPLSQYRAELHQIEHLSCLLSWLVRSLKEAKDSGRQLSKDNIHVDMNLEAKLTPLLCKCLLVLMPANNNLWDSAALLAQIQGKGNLAERLKKLGLLSSAETEPAIEITNNNLENVVQQQEDCISQAAKKLEILKLCLGKDKSTSTMSGGGNTERRAWTVVKSWTPCPIGMLPSALGYSGALPVLWRADDDLQENLDSVENEDVQKRNWHADKMEANPADELLENTAATEKMNDLADGNRLASSPDHMMPSRVKGRLLVDGFWKKVGEEELAAIESAVRMMA